MGRLYKDRLLPIRTMNLPMVRERICLVVWSAEVLGGFAT